MAASIDVTRLAETAVQGKVVGFIRPPPDIRVIVDKTAGFIAKYGDHMEAKIMEKEAGNMKFGFLKSDDPYHAYYRHKVQELRAPPPAPVEAGASASASAAASAGTDSGAAAGASSAASAAPAAAPAASVGVTAAKSSAATSMPNPLSRALKSFDGDKPFIKDEFLVPIPAGAAAQELDMVKLTAQYTALGGKDFLRQLSSREFRNPSFDFLRPSHPLFTYYTALVDSYNKVLNPPTVLRDRISAQAASGYLTLERGVHRLEAKRITEQRRREEDEEAAATAAAIAAIDWHDFVIVESIAFPVDEDLNAAAAEGGAAVSGSGAAEDMETDGTAQDRAQAAAEEEYARAAALAADDSTEKLNIRLDYVPSVAGSGAGGGASGAAPTHFIDPRTGQAIPIASASQHLRVDLLDPQWKEQTARAAAKQATTLYASGDVIADNLRRLAAARGDVFRGDEEEGGPPGTGSAAGPVGPAMPRVAAAGSSVSTGGQAKRARQGE